MESFANKFKDIQPSHWWMHEGWVCDKIGVDDEARNNGNSLSESETTSFASIFITIGKTVLTGYYLTIFTLYLQN